MRAGPGRPGKERPPTIIPSGIISIDSFFGDSLREDTDRVFAAAAVIVVIVIGRFHDLGQGDEKPSLSVKNKRVSWLPVRGSVPVLPTAFGRPKFLHWVILLSSHLSTQGLCLEAGVWQGNMLDHKSTELMTDGNWWINPVAFSPFKSIACDTSASWS